MKILVVNRNYFITGGPEKYLFSLMENMPHHRFIPFAVDFKQNLETPYRRYFLEPPGGRGNVYFDEFKLPFHEKVRFAINMVYYREAREKLRILIKDTRPDVALFLNAVYFTDSIIDACRESHVPVIWRMSDFNKICANYLLYRDGHTCEDCIEKGLFQCVLNRCGGYQRSLASAAVKYAGMKLSRMRNCYDHVSYFITPSEFTRKKMILGGFREEQVVCIPTFIRCRDESPQPCTSNDKILYVGRLSPEKGVHILVDAFRKVRNKKAVLTIVGDTNNPYARSLMQSIDKEFETRIQFAGFKGQDEVDRLYRDHSFFIVPSLWYENQPNVVLEGMANARSAVVSHLGSLCEAIQDGRTGYHFMPGDSRELACKIDDLLEHPDKARTMGLHGYEHVRDHHSPRKHMLSLESLMESCAR